MLSQYFLSLSYERNHDVLINNKIKPITLCTYCLLLFVCFVALHPKSTAMVMAGR